MSLNNGALTDYDQGCKRTFPQVAHTMTIATVQRPFSTQILPKDMDDAESVVKRTLEAFDQKRDVAYSDRMSVRLTSWLPRLLPRALVARIAGNATAKMSLAG